MKRDGNRFIFLFSSIMVVVVAILLSLAAINLGPYQARNIRLEKMQNILSSIGVQAEPAEAEKLFNRYIKEQVVLNSKGEKVTGGVSAFDIDLKKELDKARFGKADEQLFPLFICERESRTYYIIPMRGKGLWGPIWGFLALEQDGNTVHGVSFGHKGETPGLGAEIETAAFQQQFAGKKIFDDQGNFVSVTVVKGGAREGDTHGVDAISGATVTSTGVTEMIHRTLGSYVSFFKSLKS